MVPLGGEPRLAPQKCLIPFCSLLLLFTSDSEHLWLLFSSYEHYCLVHPKIARPSYPIIPSPGQSKQGWQGLQALLPVPFFPAASTSPALLSASSRVMRPLLVQQPQVLPDKSQWSCQHRQGGAAGLSLRETTADTKFITWLGP